MKNLQYLENTFRHRQAFRFTVEKLIEDKVVKAHMLERARFHDLDKAVLYTLMDKKEASHYHKLHSPHHMGSDNISITSKSYYDIMEAMIDYECGGYTKADKPLNAYDWLHSAEWMPGDIKAKLELMLIGYQINYSYRNTPDDPDWVEYKKSLPEPTEELIMSEIYDYLIHTPDNVLTQKDLDLKYNFN
jgi:hypothetical protein